MPKPNMKRLETLRDYLKTLPSGIYDQGDYGREEDGKFVGCGFGHATQIPAFRKAGLSGGMYSMPSYKGELISCAFAKFFGLPVSVIGWLSVKGYKKRTSPTEMIKRLDAVIENRIVETFVDGYHSGYKIVPKKKVLETR